MKLKLKRVRLSYPALYKPRAFEEGDEPRFEATFLLDKRDHAASIKEIRTAAKQMLIAKYGSEASVPKGFKLSLRDGIEKPDTEGYGAGIMFISSSSKTRRPVVDRDPSVPLVESDGRPYAGCYVNASIRLWIQDNKWGKRVNAEFLAIQFVADGEPFGDGAVDPEEEFSNEADPDDTDLGGGDEDADEFNLF